MVRCLEGAGCYVILVIHPQILPAQERGSERGAAVLGLIRYGDLAEYVIAYCNLDNVDVSNKKLQKLVYYCQAWNLALTGERLIDHTFEAWVHGAVLRPLYIDYSGYGYTNIVMEHEVATAAVNRFARSVKAEQLQMVNKVLSKYAHHSADDLEKMNHSEYPWQKTREGLDDYEHCNRTIPDDLIREYYGAKALEKGMKQVKDNIFKFSSAGLKKAQEELKHKKVFEITEDNAQEYMEFISASHQRNALLARRAEYAEVLRRGEKRSGDRR